MLLLARSALAVPLCHAGVLGRSEAAGLARRLSSAEVSTALRPFYFLVHPDLFGKHPREAAENEVNLKSAKNYIETMVEGGPRPSPREVRFYMRPKAVAKAVLPTVRIRLRDATLRRTVLTILRGCDLPTDFVDSIPVSEEEQRGQVMEEVPRRPWRDDLWSEGSQQQEESSGGFSPTDKGQPFLAWLTNNVGVARTRLQVCEPIRLEIERLQGGICYEYELEDIAWDCGWETVHRRGTVQSFQAMLLSYPSLQDIVRGRTIVFGKDSGVALGGEIVLYSGEVRNNWLNVVKTAPELDRLLAFMPLSERSLSMALRGVTIHHDPANIVMIDEYRARIRRLVTSLADYRTRKSLPPGWPEDMSQYRVMVEGESSALMLSPEGVFILPASTPGFLVVEFLTGGMEEAARRARHARSLKVEEENLVYKCINELGLIQLDRDEMISPAQMVACCSRLLKAAARIRYLTHGNHLVVARYYMVKRDGVICIPWDLVMDLLPGEQEAKEERPTLHLTMH